MHSDPYEVLGVAIDADIDAIKARYRQLVRENHPDIAPDKDAANARMVEILEAWRILSDPERKLRLDTDRRLAAEKARAAVNGPRSPHPGVQRSQSMHSAQPRVSPTPGRAAGSQKNGRSRSASGQRNINPRARLLNQVNEAAALYFREGKAEEAINLCQRVLKADSRNVEAILLLGDIFASQGNVDVALVMYDKVLLMQPNNLLVRRKREALAPRAATPAKARPVQASPSPAATPTGSDTTSEPDVPTSLFGRLKARLGHK